MVLLGSCICLFTPPTETERSVSLDVSLGHELGGVDTTILTPNRSQRSIHLLLSLNEFLNLFLRRHSRFCCKPYIVKISLMYKIYPDSISLLYIE